MPFNDRKNPRFSRRNFLQTAIATGAALELPWLGRTPRAQAAAPLNFVTVFVPDGVVPSLWYPTGGETDFSLPTMSEPLNAIKKDCIFFEGVGMPGGEPTHPGGTKKVITATAPQSLDVFLGQKLKGSAPFDSIQLGVASNFENGSGSISFIGTAQEVKPDDDPLNVFNRLFGGAAPGMPGQPVGGGGGDLDLRQKQKKSIIDVMKADLSALQMKLGTAEKARLDVHLQSLRDVETRLNGLVMPPAGMGGGGAPVMACDASGFNKIGYKNVDTGYPKSYHKVENFNIIGQLQTDLLVLALSCSLTHSAAFMWSHAVSPTKVPGLDGAVGNHDASHYGVNPQSPNALQYVKYRRFFMERFVELVQRLKAIPYGDSNLLDHTVLFLCSDINDGDLHDQNQMPFVLAGGARAGLKGGRFLSYKNQGMGGKNETHAKLLVSICRALGQPVDSYGYTAMGTGPLTRL